MADGLVREDLVLPSGTTYTIVLEVDREIEHGAISTAQTGIRVTVNREIAEKWAHTDQISMSVDLSGKATKDNKALTVLIEKDLPCQSH